VQATDSRPALWRVHHPAAGRLMWLASLAFVVYFALGG
jgi:hypothetical protein